MDSESEVRADLIELRRLLDADRDRTTERIVALSEGRDSIVDAASLTATDDEHDPEGSTIAFERSLTITLLAEATEHLGEVDSALERIGQGDYGTCECCAEAISPGRLLVRPAARRCITCAV